MIIEDFFKTIFNEDDWICHGNRYANKVFPIETSNKSEFFAINPLDSKLDHGYMFDPKYDRKIARRADINVARFSNFMFEMDSTSLEDQLKILLNCSLPITSIVFSGGKSYHAILSVDEGVGLTPHTLESIEDYKKMWARLAARIDFDARKMGFEYPQGKSSFIDSSCKNPSRLSRFPGIMRDNNRLQKLVRLRKGITKEDFYDILEKCPEVKRIEKVKYNKPDTVIEDEETFWTICPPKLRDNIKFTTWAGSEGMYPNLLRITLWAIDSTNIEKELLLDILNRHTFPSLMKRGYPRHKLEVAIDHAFKLKENR